MDTAPRALAGEDSHRTKGLIRLTMACNERCPFCNVPQEDYERLTPPPEAIDAELQQFLDAGAQTLVISGGEPTLLRKRLIALVRKARAGTVRFVELQTNAVLIDEAYAAELAQAGVTSAFVSLLSHLPEHHDRLAGLPGAFEKCLRGIDAMLDAGIRVTLNPVTARLTQDLVPDYIDFVARRLPGVRFVSMSAVQPHGRARDNIDLLPDYDVLARSIREARRRAAAHDIELVNPYCGLPLCVGWDDAPEQSVEAFEAEHGGWQRTPGLDNVGNKSHGGPCAGCALRTRCGGAWHAYWDERGGAGIVPPLPLVEPWTTDADAAPGHHVVRTDAIDADALARLADTRMPTRWLVVPRLRPSDVTALMGSAATDVAVVLPDLDGEALRDAVRAARRIADANAGLMPQSHLRVWIGVPALRLARPEAVLAAALLVAAGTGRLRLLGDAALARRIATAVRQREPAADIAVPRSAPPPEERPEAP